jgi:predicted nucleotidyltransferase component of viral defense system
LKGGTCINLFHSDLPRLSVDMDLNYVGSADRDVMIDERPAVMVSIRDLAREHGYVPEDIRMSYAGWTARLVYESVRDSPASIKVDVNFLNRVPLFPVQRLPLPEVLDLGDAEVPCLGVDEVFGGKLKALAVRGEPRDVFDTALLSPGGVMHDPSRLRKAFLFYGFMDDASLSTFDLDAISRLGTRDYEQRLYPVLRRGDRPDPEELADRVLPMLEGMLDLTPDEEAFCPSSSSVTSRPPPRSVPTRPPSGGGSTRMAGSSNADMAAVERSSRTPQLALWRTLAQL